MAMDASALGSALARTVESAAKSDDTTIEKVWTAIATEIIAHLKANAVVSTQVTTAGSASAQTGTGTGTIS